MDSGELRLSLYCKTHPSNDLTNGVWVAWPCPQRRSQTPSTFQKYSTSEQGKPNEFGMYSVLCGHSRLVSISLHLSLRYQLSLMV